MGFAIPHLRIAGGNGGPAGRGPGNTAGTRDIGRRAVLDDG